MPAISSIEELRQVNEGLVALKATHPEAYADLSAFLKKWRHVGYKNIIKLMLGEATPEKLKGEA